MASSEKSMTLLSALFIILIIAFSIGIGVYCCSVYRNNNSETPQVENPAQTDPVVEIVEGVSKIVHQKSGHKGK